LVLFLLPLPANNVSLHSQRGRGHHGTEYSGNSRQPLDPSGDGPAQDFLIAYSCKRRGVCPSCNAWRMVEAAAHLTDHVFPRLPVRQWVLSVPKRLRYFLHQTLVRQRILRLRPSRPDLCKRRRRNGRLGARLWLLRRCLGVHRRHRPARTGTAVVLLRPPFALEHLQQRDAEHLVYYSPKPRPDGPGDSALTPFVLCDRFPTTSRRTPSLRHTTLFAYCR